MLGRSSFLSELEPYKTVQHTGSGRCKPTTDSRAFITHAFRTAPAKCRRLDPELLAASASRNGRAGSPPPPIPPEELGELGERILSGEFTEEGSTREKLTRPVRKLLAKDPIGPGRWLSKWLTELARQWQIEAAARMPEARGDIREIVGEPVFVPLYKLFLVYGGVFRLSFGPKSFVIVSDPAVAKQILLTNASRYSKGILSEILDFVMGKGLIPANGEIWRTRRRAVVPALHKKFLASMVGLFGDSSLHGIVQLEQAAAAGQPVEMENFFSRLTLDIIGKAVFNYDFDSLTHDDPVIKAVYTALREAEHRSTAFLPYWNLPLAKVVIPRQRRCQEAMAIINSTLDGLVAKCQQLVDVEDQEFEEEFLSQEDPSMLHFLLASGEEVSSQQLRDDLMTLLIAGHETTAAVLTWTLHCLVQHPEFVGQLQEEVDRVLGDRRPTMAELKQLPFATRVINEAMRLYPQPPVLIRRALEPDCFAGYHVAEGSDIFISVWNLHRSPELWERPQEFNPLRFPLDRPVPNEVTHDFAYLPFGGGKRKCIGDQFALFESVVALAMLARRFDFRLAANAPKIGMTTGATIHTSDGLLLDILPRTSAPPAALQLTFQAPAVQNGSRHAAALSPPLDLAEQQRPVPQNSNGSLPGVRIGGRRGNGGSGFARQEGNGNGAENGSGSTAAVEELLSGGGNGSLQLAEQLSGADKNGASAADDTEETRQPARSSN